MILGRKRSESQDVAADRDEAERVECGRTNQTELGPPLTPSIPAGHGHVWPLLRTPHPWNVRTLPPKVLSVSPVTLSRPLILPAVRRGAMTSPGTPSPVTEEG